MDGGDVWQDNDFVARLWSSVTYARVYLYAYGFVDQIRACILDILIARFTSVVIPA